MVRHCPICMRSFPTEQYQSRRAANRVLNDHLYFYHPEYVHWAGVVYSRLPLIFLVFLIADLFLFNGPRNRAPPIGPFPWQMLVVIVLLELLATAWVMRFMYGRKVRALRLEWQENSGYRFSAESMPPAEERDMSISTNEVEPGEIYLGGFYSRQMYPGYGGARKGYGIYFTSQRILGITWYNSSRADRFPLLSEKLSQDENDRLISSLKKMSSQVISRDRITKIKLKIPRGLFRSGYLQIILDSGEVMRINIVRRLSAEKLREILQELEPGKLITEEQSRSTFDHALRAD